MFVKKLVLEFMGGLLVSSAGFACLSMLFNLTGTSRPGTGMERG